MINLHDPADVLSRVLYGEAGNQGLAGLRAVASVVVNRAHHPRWWGTDIISVCTKPWQFSCLLPEPTGQRSRLFALTAADAVFRLAQAVAKQAVAGALPDTTHGADSYANLSLVKPSWIRGLTPCAVIGAHTFYRTELPAPPAAHPSVDTPVS